MEDKILESVVSKIEYIMLKDVLVKPLEPIKVTKEITEQIPTGEVDEEGFNKYETKTETKEVDSAWTKGIVLVLPSNSDSSVNVGDTIIYNKRSAIDFDIFKNSQLVKPYDIVAICKNV